MKKLIYTVFLAASLLFLETRCSDSQEAKPREKEAVAEPEETTPDFYITPADGMKLVDNLNADAALQYSDVSTGRYLIIVEEPVTDVKDELKAREVYDENKSFLENFSNFRVKQLEENSVAVEKIGSRALLLTRDAISGLTTELRATMSDVPEKVYYQICFAEHGDRSFMIMAWTLESQEKAFAPSAKKMIESFRMEH